MRNLKKMTGYALCIILVAVLGACSERDKNIRYDNLGILLTKCEGFGVVVAKGVNEGNYAHCKNFVIVKDARGVCFEYIGAEYTVETGDTLIVKPNSY